jgi:hypothetical protein
VDTLQGGHRSPPGAVGHPHQGDRPRRHQVQIAQKD